MKHVAQDLRQQTLELVLSMHPAAAHAPQTPSMIETWLASLDEHDVAGISPESLASVMWEGFSHAVAESPTDGRIVPLLYADGRGGQATALLIINRDMPFLVD